MASTRALLARVHKLERGRADHPIAEFGTPEFEAQIRAECAEGKLDARDWLGESGTGGVLRCLQRWADERLWLTARR